MSKNRIPPSKRPERQQAPDPERLAWLEFVLREVFQFPVIGHEPDGSPIFKLPSEEIEWNAELQARSEAAHIKWEQLHATAPPNDPSSTLNLMPEFIIQLRRQMRPGGPFNQN